MAFDFPNTPTEGQIFTPSGGPTYVYHAPVWELYTTSSSVAAAPFDALQINGSMEVSQELGGAVTSRANSYCCDQWLASWGGGYAATTEASAAGAPSGLGAALKVVVTTGISSPPAGSWFNLTHLIEGYRCLRLAWGTASAQPITLAFWVKASRTGLHGGSIRNGAATFRSYPFTYTINVSATWEYKTIIIPGDTTGTWNTWNLIGMNIFFDIASGSSSLGTAGAWATGNFIGSTGCVNNAQAGTDYFHITGLLVLPGTQAPTAAQSPFIMRPYDQELVTCKRYFYTGIPPLRGVYNTSGAIGRLGALHPMPMRTSPTVTITAPFLIWDGTTTGSVPSVMNNYSTTSALEFDGNIATGMTAVGRALVVLQDGGGNLMIDARL